MGLYRRALQIIMQFQIWVPVSTDPTFVKPQAMNTQLTRWAPTLFSTTPRPGFHTALCYSLYSCSVALLATCPSLWSSTQKYVQQCGGNVLLSWREEEAGGLQAVALLSLHVIYM